MNTIASPMLFSDLLVIHWIFNPVILVILSKKFYGSFKFLAFPNMFLITYFVFIYFQAFSLYTNNVKEPDFIISVWIVPYIFVITSGLFLSISNHSCNQIAKSFYKFKISKRDREIAKWSFFISLFFVGLPILYIFDKGLNNIALFFLFSNPGKLFIGMELRIDGLNSNYGGLVTSIYSYSRALFYPLYVSLLVIFLSCKIISLKHFLIVFLSGCLFSVLTAAKAPLALMLIAVLLSFYFSRKGKIHSALLLLFINISLLAPAMIYLLVMNVNGEHAFWVVLDNLWRRLTWVPCYASALYFKVFPSIYDFLGFNSNRFFVYLFDGKYTPSAPLVYEHYSRSGIEGGLINASYFASFYADWGMIGVCIGTFFVALIIGGIQLLFDRSQSDAIETSMRVVVLLGVAQLNLTNFYSVAWGRGLLSLPLLIIIFKIFPRKRMSYLG